MGEWLSLDFTPAVGTLLNAIVFEQGTESGELEVYTGTEKIATISWAAAAGNSLISFSNFDQVAGSEFRFVATEGEFRLNQVTFAAVPEAGSIFIWSLGGMTILGMLWVRRSRQAA